MLSLVFDKNERKFQSTSYSQTYNIQLQALRQGDVQIINDDCSAQDIKGDAVLFYDLHSTHHIKIDGIEKLDIPKIEYMDDPHQEEQSGKWRTGQVFHKLGRKQRMDRARQRGVTKILSSCKEGYYKYLYPYSKGLELAWIPFGFDLRFFEGRNKPLKDRNGILISGSTLCGNYSFYDFRKWVYKHIDLQTGDVYGIEYWKWLSNWKVALALCETYVVPKYFEVAAAGCVPIFQWSNDLLCLGFRHGVNCLIVDKTDIVKTLNIVLKNTDEYQPLVDNARKLIEEKFTTKNFVERIYKVINGTKQIL